MNKLKVISGRAHPRLARKIAKALKIKLTPVEIKNFAFGEIYFRIKEKVRSSDVFLIQTICPPVNEHLMELLIAIDALKRASAGRINVVCPHLGYSRQDRKSVSREPITAKLVANLISTAGADRLLTVDLHADQIQGFYDIPVDHFSGYSQFIDFFQDKKCRDLVIVAPDVGAVKLGRKMARLLKNAPLAIIDKRRPKHNCAKVMNIIGEVKGKTTILVDDMIDTAGTISEAAIALKKNGAKEIIICATHGLFSGEAVEKLKNCPASKVYITDTLPLLKENKIPKIKVVSLAPLLAQVIRRIHRGQSLGALFTWENI